MHATRFTRPMVGIGWFLVHFVEMWVAMMIGMLIFHAVLIPALLALGVSA